MIGRRIDDQTNALMEQREDLLKRAVRVHNEDGGQKLILCDLDLAGEGLRLQLSAPKVRSEAQLRDEVADALARQPRMLRIDTRKLPAYVAKLRWSYFDPLGKPAAFPSSFSDLSMWIARVEGSGDAPLFAGEYAFSKREKKTSREAAGASADDDAMTSIGCGGAYPKRPPRKPACQYEME